MKHSSEDYLNGPYKHCFHMEFFTATVPLLGSSFTREYLSCTMHEGFLLLRFLIWGIFRTRLSFSKLIAFLFSFLCFCCSLKTQYAIRFWKHNGCASLHSRTRFDFLLIELTTHPQTPLTHTHIHSDLFSCLIATNNLGFRSGFRFKILRYWV